MEFAKVKSGHDKGHVYLLYKRDEQYVYLVNGTTKGFEHPKRKNPIHVQPIKNLPESVKGILSEEPLTDERVARAIDTYLSIHTKEE